VDFREIRVAGDGPVENLEVLVLGPADAVLDGPLDGRALTRAGHELADRGPAFNDPIHEPRLFVDPGIALQDRGLGAGQDEMALRGRIGESAFPGRERVTGDGKMSAPMRDGIVDPRIDRIIDDGDADLHGLRSYPSRRTGVKEGKEGGRMAGD
jgi:hypothetical protein